MLVGEDGGEVRRARGRLGQNNGVLRAGGERGRKGGSRMGKESTYITG